MGAPAPNRENRHRPLELRVASRGDHRIGDGNELIVAEEKPVDGLLLGSDQFMAVTDATITSGSHPELERTAPVLAVRRRRAHVLLVADDENPDQLLADVLDERTAEAWLRPDTEGG